MLSPSNGCAACGLCSLGVAELPAAAAGRGLNLAAGMCLGLPLVVLVAGAWLADALAPGQAWLAMLLFAGTSGAVARMGSRVDTLLLEQVE